VSRWSDESVLLQLILVSMGAGLVVVRAVRLARTRPAAPTSGQSSKWSARQLSALSILELPGVVGLLGCGEPFTTVVFKSLRGCPGKSDQGSTWQWRWSTREYGWAF
jgi:hypothetical protein